MFAHAAEKTTQRTRQEKRPASLRASLIPRGFLTARKMAVRFSPQPCCRVRCPQRISSARDAANSPLGQRTLQHRGKGKLRRAGWPHQVKVLGGVPPLPQIRLNSEQCRGQQWSERNLF